MTLSLRVASALFFTTLAAAQPRDFRTGVLGGQPITFEVVAYQTSRGSYDNSIIRGRSGSFTMNSIATGAQPSPFLGDNGQSMPNFVVARMPEPATLTLAGMGGLMALVVFRRQQKKVMTPV